MLSSQFVGGLVPQIKRKIAYLEGVTFSELWQKARFEEARLKDLESAAFTNPNPRNYQAPTTEQYQENTAPPYQQNQRLNRDPPRQFRHGEHNPTTIVCYKCRQPGHVARNCRQGTRFQEARGRQNTPRTAAVTPEETVQQAGTVSSAPSQPLNWMYGVRHDNQDGDSSKQSTLQSLSLGPMPKLPVTMEGIEVEALVDTGCPATIISKTLCRQILDSGHEQGSFPTLGEHRCQRAKNLQLSNPSVQLHAYCGSRLSIGAEVTVDLKAGECQVKGVVLVQESTPVDLLLGTDLMPKLGIKILDAKGQSLLENQNQKNRSPPVTTEEGSTPNDIQQSMTAETPLLASEKDTPNNTASKPRQPTPCQIVGGGRHRSGPTNSGPQQKGIVGLVRACKLPARSGKLLQARMHQTHPSSSPQLFEPDGRLNHDQTVDIPNSLLSPNNKGQLLLPVYNFAEVPTWLRRGQILGWIWQADVVESNKGLHPLPSTHESPFNASPMQSSPNQTKA